MTDVSNVNTNAPKRVVDQPDRVFTTVDGLDEGSAARLAQLAVEFAGRLMPRVTGASARDLRPIYGEGYFGIRWTLPHIWYQEKGINPFTMRALAGKTIPMWVNDPTGEVERQNPKAKTRVTDDGRNQVLIFRKAAQHGKRRSDGSPASYPGSPGRIAARIPSRGGMPSEWQGLRRGGQIAPFNVGVRWRHPGLRGKHFCWLAVHLAAGAYGIEAGPIYSTDQRWRG